jgi:hypothetical protein
MLDTLLHTWVNNMWDRIHVWQPQMSLSEMKYSFVPKKVPSLIFNFCVANLNEFVEKCTTFVSRNKFYKKLDSNIYIVILILYYKY